MMDFLIKHKLINPLKHGFLKARSCLTNLLCFFEEITKWVDDGSIYLSILYCELSNLYTGLFLELSFSKSGGVHDSYTFQCGLVGYFTSPGIDTR